MKGKIVISTISMCIALLAGCTSQQDRLNQVTNWKEYGFEEASKGKKVLEPSLISQTQYDDYMIGYKMGTKVFCTQDPYKLGMRGADYHNQCDEKNPNFEEQYKLGYLEFLAYQNKLRQE